MRQWMVDPKIMCRKHLLGEHVEHHMFVGTINKGTSIAGYLLDNLLEPASLHARHNAIAAEMEARGYNHYTPLQTCTRKILEEDMNVKIDKEAALKDLLSRCPECQTNYLKIYGKPPQ